MNLMDWWLILSDKHWLFCIEVFYFELENTIFQHLWINVYHYLFGFSRNRPLSDHWLKLPSFLNQNDNVFVFIKVINTCNSNRSIKVHSHTSFLKYGERFLLLAWWPNKVPVDHSACLYGLSYSYGTNTDSALELICS